MSRSLSYISGVFLAFCYNLQYRFRYKRYQSVRIDSDTLYIHIPKTGGSAVSEALGIATAGHFTVAERESAAGRASRIVVTIRDPIDRLTSLWKYSRKKSQGRIYSPLYRLRSYGSLEQFIKSGTFKAFIKYHYFFRTQSSYLEGYVPERHKLVVLRQETLAADVKCALDLDIGVVNKSPEISADLSEASIKYLRQLFSEDYRLLNT